MERKLNWICLSINPGFNEELFNADEYSYEDDSDPNNLNFDPALDLYGWQPDVG